MNIVCEECLNIMKRRQKTRRWIAEIPELPGVMVYGDTRKQAISKAEALALRVMADRSEHDEEIPELTKTRPRHESMAVNKSSTGPNALVSHGWTIKRQHGTSHRVLARPGWPDYVFAFHDREEIGAKMLHGSPSTQALPLKTCENPRTNQSSGWLIGAALQSFTHTLFPRKL